MIVDIENNKKLKDIRISYIDVNGDRQILEVKKRDFWFWKYNTRYADKNFQSWNRKGVSKGMYSDSDYIDRKSVWEWMNTHP